MYRNPFEEKYLVIAEKPSVALAIAKVMGFRDQKDGYVEGPDGVITWCYGHLAEYAMPEAYDERYKKWALEDLPIIPDPWKLTVPGDKKKQFNLLKELLNNKKFLVPFDYVVNACDCGREGENIFRRVYSLSGSSLPIKRLWISSMEDEAIFQGFSNLRDGKEYENLAQASVCRAKADWLVGMNASRAFTKIYDCRLSVGRVQTPTLAMLAQRDEQISGFEKKQFFITHLIVESMGQRIDAVSERFHDREEANRLAGTCSGRTASVSTLERKTRTALPPKLYDLTTLQRDANRIFGLSASKALACAQKLYESKLITYPRTDSRYLTDDMEQTAAEVLKACNGVFPFLKCPGTAGQESKSDRSAVHGSYAGENAMFGSRESRSENTLPANDGSYANIKALLNSSKVSDHHAIIPTIQVRWNDLDNFSDEEQKVLSLIALRLACAAGNRHVYETVKATILCCGYPFTASGMSVREDGWKQFEKAFRAFYRIGTNDNDSTEGTNSDSSSDRTGMGSDIKGSGYVSDDAVSENQNLSTLYQGQSFFTSSTQVSDHWTKPPKHYTEDTLLLAMEVAGASQTDPDAERKGLGTPATRAAIIEKLIQSNYAARTRKTIVITDAGKQLIAALPDYLKSAQMTAEWENQLLMMERGEYDHREFMDGIIRMLQYMLEECGQISPDERKRFAVNAGRTEKPTKEPLGKCPACGSPVYEGKRNFYCSNPGCRFLLWKENHFLERMQAKLNAAMVKDLLSCGRTTVKDLYSPKKDKYFTGDLIMQWKDDRASYSLDFPNASSSSKT